MADGQYGSADEFWQDVEPDGLYLVAMYGTHAVAYQRWLRSHGQFLARVSRDDVRGAELFAVKLRATAPPAAFPEPTFTGPPGVDDDDAEFDAAMRMRRRDRRR